MYEIVESKGAKNLPLTASILEAVLEEYVQHIVSIGQAIKLIYAISEYDGILALKEFVESFVDGKFSIEIDKDKAKHFITTVLTKDLENLIVRMATLSTGNPVLKPVLVKYQVSDELCSTIEEISGVNINNLELNVEGKAKMLSVAKYIVASCDSVLK